jgi:hypothetical protein
VPIGLGILAGTMLLFFKSSISEIQMQALPANVINFQPVAAGLWLRERRRLKIVRLEGDRLLFLASCWAKRSSNSIGTASG